MGNYYCKDEDKNYYVYSTGWYSFCGGCVVMVKELEKAITDKPTTSYSTIAAICDGYVYTAITGNGYAAVYPGTHAILMEHMSKDRLAEFHSIRYTIGTQVMYVWMWSKNRLEYGKHNMTGANRFPPINEKHVIAMLHNPSIHTLPKLRQPGYIRAAIKGVELRDDGTVLLPPDNGRIKFSERLRTPEGSVLGTVNATIPDAILNEPPMLSTLSYVGAAYTRIRRVNLGVYETGLPIMYAAIGVDTLLDFFDNILSGLAIILNKEVPANNNNSIPNKTLWMSDNLMNAFGTAGEPLDTGGVMNLFLHYNQKGKYSKVLKDGTRIYFRIVPMLCGNPVHMLRPTNIAVVSLNPIKEEVLA